MIQRMNFELSNAKLQTLFLDRDGVINKHRPDDYVKEWSEFEFLPKVTEAFSILARYFKRIIVVTNQRGVGKGLMTESDLQEIHKRMVSEIAKAGGRIDTIYFCTDINHDSPNRKPNSGMALQAQKDFPEITFENAVMIGDSSSDMEFGERLGMKSYLVNQDNQKEGLWDFARFLQEKNEPLNRQQ